MTKQEFLTRLKEGLTGLPQDDIAERLAFYSEMIDDRMEEGLSEEEAVAGIGPVDNIVSQIVAETPITRLVREKVKPKRRLQAWEIILLILGSPLWIALLIAAFAVVLSLYIVIWAVIVSLWAVDIAFLFGAVAGLAVGNMLIWQGEKLQGALMICAGFVLAGLAIFLFFGCKALTKGAASLTIRLTAGIKSLFLGKDKSK